MAPFKDVVLPLGSTILVTGVNGYVGSHVADRLLDSGYKVRGTVRDMQKHGWLVELFNKRYGEGTFELMQVEDMAKASAFDSALKGVTGVAHVAAHVSMTNDPQGVTEANVGGTLNVLQAAAKEPSVLRFVLTSATLAVRQIEEIERPGAGVVTANEYNETAIKLARSMPDSLPELKKGMIVYAAAKAMTEKAVWDWLEQNKSRLVVNSVIPPGIFGQPISVQYQGYPSSAGGLVKYFEGKPGLMDYLHRSYYTSVEDVARLHVAGLILPRVESQRIFAIGGVYTINDLHAIFRETCPDRKFPNDIPGLDHDLALIGPRSEAEALLKDMGRPGFDGLEETVRDTIKELVSRDE